MKFTKLNRPAHQDVSMETLTSFLTVRKSAMISQYPTMKLLLSL